jgi:hypothetical protein
VVGLESRLHAVRTRLPPEGGTPNRISEQAQRRFGGGEGALRESGHFCGRETGAPRGAAERRERACIFGEKGQSSVVSQTAVRFQDLEIITRASIGDDLKPDRREQLGVVKAAGEYTQIR